MDHRRIERLIPVLCGMMCGEGVAYAQISRPTAINVTVVAAQVVSLYSGGTTNLSSSGDNLKVSEPGIILLSTSNIAVGLCFGARVRWIGVKQEEKKKLTATDMRGVERVEVVYLGS